MLPLTLLDWVYRWRGSAYPTSVGVRVEEIEVSCDRGKRSCSSKDVMAGFRGDLIKHVDEV
jgi:hypothetical protein